ncbi:MAG: arginine--tRNA ligase, partial [Oscillospiraceae bacterium]|nr:arginine--tRNA ligase [Oscillospiraceae bacterium]
MINMIQNAKDQVLSLTYAAYEKAAAAELLPADVEVRAGVEIPKDVANGDYTTTFALAAAKAMRKSPRDIATILVDHMDLAGSYFSSVEIAGAGF